MGEPDGPGQDGPGQDAPVDANPCPAYVTPPGALGLHTVLCNAALGFNSTATPTSMALACPDIGAAAPGTYGKILRPAMINQVNDCAATAQTTRILAPAVSGAVTQTSTAFNLTVAANSRFRARVACPMGVANCSAQIQVTGRPAMGGALTPIVPTTTVASQVIDLDVAMPAALVGATSNINLIVLGAPGTVSDVLWQSPSIAP
jgi:hypothetical protein